ncbi:hypothetical protein ABZ863_18920 [Saccharomonospora sp. NPDC046836]|uniref:hypothetical protein n=1 Tax=Saccharomonospora sp. NPDC046836 TaxID=3156921 RepID=UPI0033C98839
MLLLDEATAQVDELTETAIRPDDGAHACRARAIGTRRPAEVDDAADGVSYLDSERQIRFRGRRRSAHP